MGLGEIGGVRITIVPSWVSGWRWVHLPKLKRPTRAEGRKGTKRQWKAANAFGMRRRYGTVEPDHVLKTPAGIFCTAGQAAALAAATRVAGPLKGQRTG